MLSFTRFFRILLHTGVDSGIYLKAIGIYIVFCSIWLRILLYPTEKRIVGPCYGIIDIGLLVP